MKQFKAWLLAIARSDAPAADVEDLGEASLEWQRLRVAAEAMERLSAIRDQFPLEMGSRRYL
jgi:hypothetical protein